MDFITKIIHKFFNGYKPAEKENIEFKNYILKIIPKK